jgi:hypothetical protein
MRTNYERDKKIVQDMWTFARNEPLAIKDLLPFGFADRERYRRYVGDIVLEFTLESDEKSKIWSYELAVLDKDGAFLDPDIVQYWLEMFFGNQSGRAARRSMLFPAEARFTFPYS